MGDMAEGFRAMTKHKKEKREHNTFDSTRILEKAMRVLKTFTMEKKNDGAHIVVFAKNDTFDFWPSTGLFISRGTKKKKRGVMKLIQYL